MLRSIFVGTILIFFASCSIKKETRNNYELLLGTWNLKEVKIILDEAPDSKYYEYQEISFLDSSKAVFNNIHENIKYPTDFEWKIIDYNYIILHFNDSYAKTRFLVYKFRIKSLTDKELIIENNTEKKIVISTFTRNSK